MTDEIVRYSRIKAFIFQPRAFFAFADLKYNLHEDEIILLNSLLTQEYFEDMVPMVENTYAKFNTYETAVPAISQPYSEEMLPPGGEMIVQNIETVECPLNQISEVAGKWKDLFPLNSLELSFENVTEICSFNLIVTLIKQNDVQYINITRNELKEVLVEEYLKWAEEYLPEILEILNLQGKKIMSKQIGLGQNTLESMIMSNEYYATNLDIWLLARRFNIPMVFISATTLVEHTNEHLLVAHADGSNQYYFIKSPGVRTDNIPVYKLIVAPNSIAKIPLEQLAISLQDEIRPTPEPLLEYIRNFREDTPIKKIIKKRKLRILSESAAPEPAAPEPAAPAMPAPKTKTKKIPGTKNINKTKKLKVKLKILPSSVEIPENNVIAKIIEKNIQQHIKKKPTKILKKLKLKIITE